MSGMEKGDRRLRVETSRCPTSTCDPKGVFTLYFAYRAPLRGMAVCCLTQVFCLLQGRSPCPRSWRSPRGSAPAWLPKDCSGLDLPADFSALVCCGVDVDVQIAGLVSLILRVGQLRARGNRPGVSVGSLGKGNDDRPVLPLRTHVNVRGDAAQAFRRDAAAHRMVVLHGYRAAAGSGSIDRGHFLGTAQRDFAPAAEPAADRACR